MTEKEAKKIFKAKGLSRSEGTVDLGNFKDYSLDGSKDRKVIQKIFRSEMQKHFEKKGLSTEKKEWKISLREGESGRAFVKLDVLSSDNVREYSMRVCGLLDMWAENDKSLISTLKAKSGNMCFVRLKDGVAVGETMSFKGVLKDMQEFLKLIGRDIYDARGERLDDGNPIDFSTGPEEDEEEEIIM